MRSLIRTRRKNIGAPNEYVNDDPKYADFFLSSLDWQLIKEEWILHPEYSDHGETEESTMHSMTTRSRTSKEFESKQQDESLTEQRAYTLPTVETVMDDPDEALPAEEQGEYPSHENPEESGETLTEENGEMASLPDDPTELEQLYNPIQSEQDDVLDYEFDQEEGTY